MKYQKGQSGNPKGRAPIILPAVTAAVEENRNALKVLILQEVNALEQNVPRIRKIVRSILERCETHGDAQAFRIIMEIALGKIVDEPKEFETTEEERQIILEYRRRKSAISASQETPSGDLSETTTQEDEILR